MTHPLLSIVIPCYNDAQYIGKAIDSAISQSYTNKEIIVVDDGSNIETKRVLRNLENKIDILITQENSGASAARNAGIKVSNGEYILVLDSDDYFENDFCARAISVFHQDENVKMVTCYARWFWDDNDYQVFKPTGGNLENFLIKNCSLGTIFLKKNWEDCGGYDEEMKGGFEDWEFYIRILKNGGIVKVLPDVLFHYRKKKISKSSVANSHRLDLLKYIYLKHAELYKDHFESFIIHLLNLLKSEEKEKIKNSSRMEFRIGRTILQPIRFFKSLFKYV